MSGSEEIVFNISSVTSTKVSLCGHVNAAEPTQENADAFSLALADLMREHSVYKVDVCWSYIPGAQRQTGESNG